MYVRLTVKLAEIVEGVDLSAHQEGDVIELRERDASLLIMGGWAEPLAAEERLTSAPPWQADVAADRPRRRSLPSRGRRPGRPR